MSGYTKLFSSIITSTIWGEPKETKVLWITMLASANKDGIVEGSVPGLARIAGLTLEETQAALAMLEAPDLFSRSKAEEGRRIKPIDGGWFLVNHAKYRALMSADERREYLRKKQAEHRAKTKASTTCQQVSTDVSDTSTPSTHSEADTDADTKNTNPPKADDVNVEETIYAAYPRKVGKKAALKAIHAALKACPHDRLLERTTAYATATALWAPFDLQFIPHPATWFNRGSYDDDPQTWKRNGAATHPKPNDRSYQQTDDYSKFGETA